MGSNSESQGSCGHQGLAKCVSCFPEKIKTIILCFNITMWTTEKIVAWISNKGFNCNDDSLLNREDLPSTRTH